MNGILMNGTMPNFLFSFNHAEILNLGFEDLEGEISSAIVSLTSLIGLDLTYNLMKRDIPRLLGNLVINCQQII